MNLTSRTMRTLIAGLLFSMVITVIMSGGHDWAMRPTLEVVLATLAATAAVTTLVELGERSRRKSSTD